ncbi:hypothetical protein O6H91_10G016600 [Diphasiastrum complanatum]|uniref:Uncharacterized protein n=1 Tax=Diphasiastrum complanatum TaxID=34168 RepID=A0ACC2CEN5_DIPCM|nr:hypothetical protein O6H91_10G016600 [Diphasiastrum complanatum]
MASVARAIEQAACEKVDPSLWWESHSELLRDLEECLASSSDSDSSLLGGVASIRALPSVQSLAERFQVQHTWLLGMLAQFKPPSASSREAIKLSRISIGNNLVDIQPELRDTTMEISKHLDLDEVQTYLLVSRCTKVQHNFQLEDELLLQALEYADMWVEETILEQSLLMDVLFLLYYKPLCICNSSRWEELLLMFQEIVFEGGSGELLAITAEAKKYIQHIRHQAMLILIEALDLDNLLLMIHGDIAFSRGKHGFSLEELQQLDMKIAGLDPADAAEYAPLMLGWATFLCLVSCLPSDGVHADSLEFEHAGYAHQAFKNGAYGFLLHMLQTDLFKEPDAPISGYKNVVKTLIAACLAAYDFSNQTERDACNVLVDILCNIYQGQEALSYELWDRESVLDGPIRSLLFSLRDCFPYQILRLVRLLSSLCEGSWSTECVYNFLYTMVDVTSLLDYSEQPSIPDLKNSLQTTRTLQLADAPGVLIPAGTLGRIERILENNSVLVKWKCSHSALLILLARLLQWPLNDSQKEEVVAIIGLLNRMLKSNKMLVSLFLDIENSKAVLIARAAERFESSLRFDIVSAICSLINNFVGDLEYDAATVDCIGILSSLANYCPMEVAAGISSTDLFLPTDKYLNISDDRSLLKYPAQSRILTTHHRTGRYFLVVSVLDFGKVLLERGIQAESILSLTKHTIQKILVDHLNWKYKQRHERWEVATKIFEFLLSVLGETSWHNDNLRNMVLEALLNDANIHDVLLQVLTIDDRSLEDLRFNRTVQPKEIEWMELAICTVLKLLNMVLLEVNAKECPIISLLEQSLFRKRESSMPFVAVVMSFMCYFRNADLQVASVELLKNLCVTAQKAQPHSFNIASHINIELRKRLRTNINQLISEDCAFRNSSIFQGVLDFLSSAVKFQPALVELLLFPWENNDYQQALPGKANFVTHAKFVADTPSATFKKSESLDAIVKILRKCAVLLKSNPCILSRVLLFLSTLWQGGAEYFPLIEAYKNEGKVWDWIGSCLPSLPTNARPQDSLESTPIVLQMQEELISTTTSQQKFAIAMQYYCQASSFHIIANDLFLQQQTLYLGSGDANPKALSVKGDVNHGEIGTDTRSGISKAADSNDSGSLSVLIGWIQSSKAQYIIQSTVFTKIEKDILLEAKAEAQALVVGLMGKILSGDTRGMNVSFIHRLREASSKILEHPAFMELFSYYSSHGFSHGEQVQTMLLIDLYYHLHGQVRGGRQVPDGPFQQVAEFLLSIELDRLLLPESHSQPKMHHPLYRNCLVYDIPALEHALGLELWPKNDGGVLPVSAAESTLQSLSHANTIASLEDAKLCALEAFSDLVTIAIFDKQKWPREALDGAWTQSNLQECVVNLCNVLEKEMVAMGPLKRGDHNMSKFVLVQAQLLLILFQWLRNRVSLGFVHGCEWFKICARVVRTSVVCLRHALETSESFHQENVPVKSLLAVFLIALELMYSEKRRDGSQENSTQSTSSGQGLGGAFVDITLAGLEFLPFLCSASDVKAYEFLSLAAINLLIKGFLASSTWLPIVHKEFPTKRAISRLSLSDVDAANALLQLCLTFSRAKKSAEMLHSAGFIDHFLVLSQQLREDSSFVASDSAGPFSIWHKRPRQQGLWGLGVAVVTAMVHVLANNDINSSIVDSAFRFFRVESCRMLGALHTPYSINDSEGKKRARFQHPQTSLSSLQETQYVIALICELVHYHVLWENALQDAASTLREMAIHLLAYIAREGLARPSSYTSAGLALIVICPPQNKEEIIAQSRAPIVGSTSAWFAVAARGSVSNSKKVIPRLSSHSSPSSPLRKNSSFSTAVVVFDNAKADFSVAYSEYSDKVAFCVYSIASLLLTFICTEVQQAIQDSEGQIPNVSRFPELPAPEILHGLQDQVMAVLTEICSAGGDKMAKEVHHVCYLLLGILEKTLYLEACLFHIYGICPLSLRSDDFSREYKALLTAAQGCQFMETLLNPMKQIVFLAYPGVV